MFAKEERKKYTYILHDKNRKSIKKIAHLYEYILFPISLLSLLERKKLTIV